MDTCTGGVVALFRSPLLLYLVLFRPCLSFNENRKLFRKFYKSFCFYTRGTLHSVTVAVYSRFTFYSPFYTALYCLKFYTKSWLSNSHLYRVGTSFTRRLCRAKVENTILWAWPSVLRPIAKVGFTILGTQCLHGII